MAVSYHPVCTSWYKNEKRKNFFLLCIKMPCSNINRMEGDSDMLLYMTSSEGCSPVSGRDEIDDCIYETAKKNEKAFARLYELTSTSVYSYAFSILKNSYDAEDVMHDCYLSIYRSAEQYHSTGKPMAWILTVTRNLCLQKIREQQKVTGMPEEDWEQVLAEDESMPLEDKLLVDKCMRVLTDEERQIIVLHAIAGFKHREIASHLGMLLPTVISKYNRGMKKLKLELVRESEAR